jgi:histidinol dehydrogenase
MKKTSFAEVSRSDFIGNRELGMVLADIENMPLHRKSMKVRK